MMRADAGRSAAAAGRGSAIRGARVTMPALRPGVVTTPNNEAVVTTPNNEAVVTTPIKEVRVPNTNHTKAAEAHDTAAK